MNSFTSHLKSAIQRLVRNYCTPWPLTAVCCIGTIWTLAFTSANGTLAYDLHYHPSLLAFVILMPLALLALPLHPVALAAIAVSLAAGWILMVPYVLTAMVAGLCVGLGVLAFREHVRSFIALGLWTIAAAASWVLNRHDVMHYGTTVMLFVAASLTAFMTGWALGWRRDAKRGEASALERQRNEIELERSRQNAEIARRIHDSLAGNLSYISLMAQRELSDLEAHDGKQDNSRTGSSENAARNQAGLWRSIEHNAVEALAGVRKVIALLESAHNSAANGQGSERRTFEAVRTVRERQLADLGITGKTVILDHADKRFNAERMNAALNLTEEIYSNLLRHCAPGTSYFMRIGIDSEGISIAEANDIRPDDGGNSVAYRLPDSGTGLVRHAKVLNDLSGTLDYREENGEWLLSAFIPNSSETSQA